MCINLPSNIQQDITRNDFITMFVNDKAVYMIYVYP